MLIKCPDCGREVASTAWRCAGCGRAITVIKVAKIAWTILLIAIAIVFLLGVIGVVFNEQAAKLGR